MQNFGGTRTMLGPQMSSKKKSAPIYGMGSGTREQQEKVFISQEHAALTPNPHASPGPAVYEQRDSVGPQVNGVKESAPRWAFGTETRFSGTSKYATQVPGAGTYEGAVGIGSQVESTKATLPRYGFGSSTRAHQEKVFESEEAAYTRNFGKASPGPSSYTLEPAVGKQLLSENGSQPQWVVGTEKRFAKEASWVPGPGNYGKDEQHGRITSAVGAQVASTKQSLPKYGFGTSDREQAQKVYLSPEHEKVTGGREAPGPGKYPIASMTGNTIASSGHGATSQKWGFGTSKRFNDTFKKGGPRMYAPGPGAYVV